MRRSFIPVPRAIYYIHPMTAVFSLVQILTTRFSFEKIASFEREFATYVGTQNALATSHARVALYTILQSLKLNDGDEILMSAINLPDMINMALLNKLKPRLFDYKEKSFDFSLEDFEQKISPKTKVVFLTTLVGLENNIKDLIEVAKKNNCIVIVDQTQSIGLKCDQVSLASLVDFSIYSLCDLKDVHTHRGAMICYQNSEFSVPLIQSRERLWTEPSKKYFLKFILEDLISSVLLRRFFFSLFVFPFLLLLHRFNQAYKLEELTKGKGVQIGKLNIGRGFWGGDGDLIRTSIPRELRYRFTDLQAKIGSRRLKWVKQMQTRRKHWAEILNEEIVHRVSLFRKDKDHLYWKYPIWVNNPREFKRLLISYGIDIAPSNLPCLSDIKAFAEVVDDKTPHAELLQKHVLYIPAHYYLRKQEIVSMGKIINKELQADFSG